MELAPRKITVSVLYVGFVKTELMDNAEKYPFVIHAERAAAAIVSAIERKVTSEVIPAMPWKLIRPLINVIPDKL